MNVYTAVALLDEKLTALERLERQREEAIQAGDRFRAHGILLDENKLGREIQRIADSVQDGEI